MDDQFRNARPVQLYSTTSPGIVSRGRTSRRARGWDEQYAYDDVYPFDRLESRLANSVRHDPGTPTFQEGWGLDASGNWGTYSQSNTGTLALSQTQTHNAANELTVISGTGAPTLTYDQAGNTALPVTPSGGTLARSGRCTYDAWNRLMQVTSGRRHHRASFATTDSADGFRNRSRGDDRLLPGGASRLSRPTTPGREHAHAYQYVWSPRYIDAAILRDHLQRRARTANLLI